MVSIYSAKYAWSPPSWITLSTPPKYHKITDSVQHNTRILRCLATLLDAWLLKMIHFICRSSSTLGSWMITQYSVFVVIDVPAFAMPSTYVCELPHVYLDEGQSRHLASSGATPFKACDRENSKELCPHFCGYDCSY